MRFSILGKLWRVVFKSRMGKGDKRHDGRCSDPAVANRTIELRKSLEGKRLLTVVIHEALHAADWWKDEAWIERVAEDIAEIAMHPEIARKIWESSKE
jgi:hypothetical protein